MSEEPKVTLCGVQGCCPTVSRVAESQVVIANDAGETVTLTLAEFEDLLAKGHEIL